MYCVIDRDRQTDDGSVVVVKVTDDSAHAVTTMATLNNHTRGWGIDDGVDRFDVAYWDATTQRPGRLMSYAL